MRQEANIIVKKLAFGAEVFPHANTTLNACLLNLQSENTCGEGGLNRFH